MAVRFPLLLDTREGPVGGVAAPGNPLFDALIAARAAPHRPATAARGVA